MRLKKHLLLLQRNHLIDMIGLPVGIKLSSIVWLNSVMMMTESEMNFMHNTHTAAEKS